MSRNDIILGLVALVLVVFSLVVSLVIPRRDVTFPGRGLKLFAAVCVLLVIAMLASVEVLGEAHDYAEEEQPVETMPEEQAPAEEPAAGDPEAGEAVFASAGCGSCHALEAAGATGTVGPDLDASQPGFELAVDRVTNGQGIMPAFGDQLTEDQIRDVAAFVATTAGR